MFFVAHPLVLTATSSDDPGDHAHRRPESCAWYHASQTHQATGNHPRLGDAIVANELHHTTPPPRLGLTPPNPPTRFCPTTPVLGSLDLYFRVAIV